MTLKISSDLSMFRKTKREREKRESAIISVSAADRGKGGGRPNTNYLCFDAQTSETDEHPFGHFPVAAGSVFSRTGSFRQTLVSSVAVQACQ
jgi:hypothetical protein